MNVINEMSLYAASTLMFLPLTVKLHRERPHLAALLAPAQFVLGSTPKVPGLNAELEIPVVSHDRVVVAEDKC
jgi:hypothetical protein